MYMYVYMQARNQCTHTHTKSARTHMCMYTAVVSKSGRFLMAHNLVISSHRRLHITSCARVNNYICIAHSEAKSAN